ncbi:MAG: hypothetical protein M3Q65_15230, partial [Chloroflexota bacterium]|nr:hypothetical protein [Chloroflexota bacterium]
GSAPTASLGVAGAVGGAGAAPTPATGTRQQLEGSATTITGQVEFDPLLAEGPVGPEQLWIVVLIGPEGTPIRSRELQPVAGSATRYEYQLELPSDLPAGSYPLQVRTIRALLRPLACDSSTEEVTIQPGRNDGPTLTVSCRR